MNPALKDLFQQALFLHEHGDAARAESLYRRLLETDPCHSDALNNLGLILLDQSKLGEAGACFQRALAFNPDDPDSHNNLGNMQYRQGKIPEATASYRRALEKNPRHTNTLCNLANALKTQGDLTTAAELFDQAISLDSGHSFARWNRSLLFLLLGDYAAAWPDFERRDVLHGRSKRSLDGPRWDGSPLGGRKVLVYSELGAGDTIQFLRFLRLIKEHGGTALFECTPEIAELLGSSAAIDKVVLIGEKTPTFDMHVPLLSIPGLLGTTIASIPNEVPYIFPPHQVVEANLKALKNLNGFRVGIAWQGNPAFPGDALRSIPVSYFEQLAEIPGVELVNLQRGKSRQLLEAWRGKRPVFNLGDQLETLSDLAAVVANLDLVITSDNSVAHIAGAMGVKTWLALQLVPDWRWLLDREDSPWYPTMRLFRQKELGNWGPVFEQIAEELAKFSRDA